MLDLSRRACTRRLLTLFVILAPRTADAYCRTTTTPVPASYSPTRGCFTDGLPLFWKGACVGYSANRAASEGIPLATVTSIIDASFASWNHASCVSGSAVGIAASNLGPVECSEVRYNTTGTNQNVIVFRDKVWPSSDPNSTLGLTTVTFNAETGEIYDADMEINATGGNLSTSTPVPANGYDLLSIMTHESGHFLGLAHATDTHATMFARYDRGTSTLRTLSPDDVAGLCEIYPTTTTRKVAASVSAAGILAATSCDPTPRHGAGTACVGDSPSVENQGSCAVGRGAPRPAEGFSTWAIAGISAFALVAIAMLRRRWGSRERVGF